MDKEVAAELLPKLKADFIKWNVEIFADDASYTIFEKDGYPMLQHAEEEDFGREFLDYKCSVKVVDGLDEALI